MSIIKRDNPLRILLTRILLEGSSLKLLFIATVFLLTLRVAPAAFAARSLSFTSNKSAAVGDEELILTASPSGFTSGETIYIKGSFYKDGSTNYFGYTKKDTGWIKNSSTTVDQRSITIGSWDNSVIVKPDYTDTGFQGNDNYLLKIGFYYLTGSNNLSSVKWSSNNVSIALTQPTPTPTPTPPPATTTPIPTNTPTSTSAPTSVLPSTNGNLSPQVLAEADENQDPEVNLDIIDLTATSESETSSSPSSQSEKSGGKNLPVVIISAAGIILMLGGGIPIVIQEIRQRKK